MAMLLSTPPATDEQSQGSTALSTLNNPGLLNFTIQRTEKSLGFDELFWRSYRAELQGRAPSCVLASCAAFLAKHVFLVFLASASFPPTLFFSFWGKTGWSQTPNPQYEDGKGSYDVMIQTYLQN